MTTGKRLLLATATALALVTACSCRCEVSAVGDTEGAPEPDHRRA